MVSSSSEYINEKLPTYYIKKVIVYQCQVINLCQEYDYILWQVSNMRWNPSLLMYQPPLKLMQKDQIQYIKNNRQWKAENNCNTFSFCLWEETDTICYFEEKKYFERKWSFNCNEEGWMTEKLTVEWLKEVWDRRPCTVLKKWWMMVLDAFRGHLKTSH